MKRILIATALIAASLAPAYAEQWWELYRSNLSTGVLDTCGDGKNVTGASPAEGFAYLSRLGYTPRYEDNGDEVDVVWNGENGQPYNLGYFRTREACLARRQIEVSKANKYQ